MSDPFLQEGAPLRLELQRLRNENRELRSTVAKLRTHSTTSTILTRSLPTTTEMVGGAMATSLHGPSNTITEDHEEAPSSSHTSVQGTGVAAAGLTSIVSVATAAQVTRPNSPASTSTKQTSNKRIHEAVLRVRKELQSDVEQLQKTCDRKVAEAAQLRRQFELFVSATCEREAAYQVVYDQLYMELEENRRMASSLQQQLEEQRTQAQMALDSLTAEVRALNARVPLDSAEAVVPGEGRPPAPAKARKGSLAPPMKKRTASVKLASQATDAPSPSLSNKEGELVSTPHDTTPQATAHHDGKVDGDDISGEVDQKGEEKEEDMPMSRSAEVVSTEPRVLHMVKGGAGLRDQRKTQRGKRPRDGGASTVPVGSLGGVATHRAKRVSAFSIPSGVVFSSTPETPNTQSAPPKDILAQDTAGPAASNRSLPNDSSSSPAPVRLSADASAAQVLRQAIDDPDLCQDPLRLWQFIAGLKGPVQTSLAAISCSNLTRLVGPPTSSSPGRASCVEEQFKLAHLEMLASVVRIIAVQRKWASLQRTGAARGGVWAVSSEAEEKGDTASGLLGRVFYALCVAALQHWRYVQLNETESHMTPGILLKSLDPWRQSIAALFGFPRRLVELATYTNSLDAWNALRLPRTWLTFTIQSIFSLCYVPEDPAVAVTPDAENQWISLCDEVGWSPHRVPLDRLEAAAVRCVVTAGAAAETALLSLHLMILYRGMGYIATLGQLLRQPGMAASGVADGVFAELVSMAVLDGPPLSTAVALRDAIGFLQEYMLRVAPTQCTSVEHFVRLPNRSHLLSALALLHMGEGDAAHAAQQKKTLQWLRAQAVAIDMVQQRQSVPLGRPLALRDTSLGRSLLKWAG